MDDKAFEDLLRKVGPQDTKCARCNYIGPVQPLSAPDAPQAQEDKGKCLKTSSGKHVFKNPIIPNFSYIGPSYPNNNYGGGNYSPTMFYKDSSIWKCEACGFVDDNNLFPLDHKS